MKHIKTFERYVAPDERNINDILDKMNKGDKTSDSDLSILRNQGRLPEIKPVEAEEQDDINIEYEYFFSDLKNSVLNEDDLYDVIERIEENRLHVTTVQKVLEDHPEISKDQNLKQIWFKFLHKNRFKNN